MRRAKPIEERLFPKVDTPDNTLPNGPRGRACRQCMNAANRRYRARQKEAQ